MAIIKCPDCGKEISEFAPVCVHCGRPMPEKKILKKSGLDLSMKAFLVLIALNIWGGIGAMGNIIFIGSAPMSSDSLYPKEIFKDSYYKDKEDSQALAQTKSTSAVKPISIVIITYALFVLPLLLPISMAKKAVDERNMHQASTGFPTLTLIWGRVVLVLGSISWVLFLFASIKAYSHF